MLCSFSQLLQELTYWDATRGCVTFVSVSLPSPSWHSGSPHPMDQTRPKQEILNLRSGSAEAIDVDLCLLGAGKSIKST